MPTLSQGFFTVPCALPVSRCTSSQEGTWPGQRAELARGMFHITEHHAHILTGESRLGGANHCLGTGLGICQWVVSNGIVHHLVFLWFFVSLCLFYYNWVFCYYYKYYILLNFNYQTLHLNLQVFTFFSDSPPQPARGWGEGVTAVFGWQLRLNHDTFTSIDLCGEIWELFYFQVMPQ